MSEFEKLCKFIHQLLLSMVFAVALMYGWQKLFDQGRDATDEQTPRGERSGITLYTDYGTGCQYIDVGGKVMRRVDATGKHLCKKVVSK